MKHLFKLAMLMVLFSACSTKEQEQKDENKEMSTKTLPKVTEVATFKGLQVTGVGISSEGRIFANFPRWRPGIPYSVAEINPADGTSRPYPDLRMNTWQPGDELSDTLFVAVQSVVAFEDRLYVLDTRNPFFKGVKGEPRIFVFDLNNNQLERIYKFDNTVVKANSYTNDLRIDKKKGKIYLTDSGEAGLIVLDMETGKSRRILDNHVSTLAETGSLLIDGKKWENTVHADGIALDTVKDRLYYHSLTGYNLYAVPTDVLDKADDVIEKSVELVSKTSAPDGMLSGPKGNLYYADLENHKIQYLTPGGEIKTLVEGEKVKWADSFAFYNGYLYYTNSRIHEAAEDVSELVFSINKVKL